MALNLSNSGHQDLFHFSVGWRSLWIFTCHCSPGVEGVYLKLCWSLELGGLKNRCMLVCWTKTTHKHTALNSRQEKPGSTRKSQDSSRNLAGSSWSILYCFQKNLKYNYHMSPKVLLYTKCHKASTNFRYCQPKETSYIWSQGVQYVLNPIIIGDTNLFFAS